MEINHLKEDLLLLSHDIHGRPELGNQEFYAQGRIMKLLTKEGWQIERNAGNLETAFVARWGNPLKPAVGFLAEYDALPEIGHGCGHNLICSASIGAALALSRNLSSQEVYLEVLGTPAEETTGGKLALLEQGYFQGLDAVMMFHPGVSNAIHFSSMALEALEVSYYGPTGHYAVFNRSPGDTLEALLQFFYQINQWKRTLSDLNQIHGIIKEGGEVPNIRPGRTRARFYLRSSFEEELDLMVKQFKDTARRIARDTGTRVEISPFESRYRSFQSNETLAKTFIQVLKRFNISCSGRLSRGAGSMDMGNVSRVVPAIHPYLTIQGGPVMLHTPEFAQAAGGQWGDELIMLAAKAMALTALQILTNESLRVRMWEEHTRGYGIKLINRSIPSK